MKKFTIENLERDRACARGVVFVRPLIERGKDVPLALHRAKKYDWLWWAVMVGYDCRSLAELSDRALMAGFGGAYRAIPNCPCSGCLFLRELLKEREGK